MTLTTSWIIATIAAAGAAAAATGANPTQQWVDEAHASGVRSLWLYTWRTAEVSGHIPVLAANGINLVSVGTYHMEGAQPLHGDPSGRFWQEITGPKRDEFRDVIRACARSGVAVMVNLGVYNDHCVAILKGQPYRKAVDVTGRVGTVLACPDDWRYWKGLDLGQIEYFAQMLRDEGAVGGIMYETEAYCATDFYPGYGSQKTRFCYCHSCFTEFIGGRRIQMDPIPPPGERYEWLCREGLDGAYDAFMEDVFGRVYGRLFERGRAINPDLLAGFYPLGFDPHSTGFARGAGTADKPPLMFAAMSYFRGFNRPDVLAFSHHGQSEELQAWLKRKCPGAWYLDGMLPGMFWPKQYASELGQMLRGADGYWTHDGSVFIMPPERVLRTTKVEYQSDFYILDTPAAYLRQIKAVNDWAVAERAALPTDRPAPPRTIPLPFNISLAPPGNGDPGTAFSLNPGALTWVPDGLMPPVLGRTYFLGGSEPVSGKRTRYVHAKLPPTIEVGPHYGLSARMTNEGASPQWATLGVTYTGIYPTFWDDNVLLQPGETRDARLVYQFKADETDPDAVIEKWVRFGVQTGQGTVSVTPGSVVKIQPLEWCSPDVALPDAVGLRLEIGGAGAAFSVEYDLIDASDPRARELVQFGTRATDLSVLRRTLGVETVRIRIRAYCPVGQPPPTDLSCAWVVG